MNTPKSMLICDANHPLISNCLKDELLLYHIDRHSEAALLERFESLSGKQIEASFELNELSGGQKVLLMLCLALLSPAKTICFKGLRHCLDEARWEYVQSIINQADKTIIWDLDQC
jgi:ABC-type Mn2+/Zn2+ transport system ATPase subunit